MSGGTGLGPTLDRLSPTLGPTLEWQVGVWSPTLGCKLHSFILLKIPLKHSSRIGRKCRILQPIYFHHLPFLIKECPKGSDSSLVGQGHAPFYAHWCRNRPPSPRVHGPVRSPSQGSEEQLQGQDLFPLKHKSHLRR